MSDSDRSTVHPAEAYRLGSQFGWQCPTCDIDERVADADEAERLTRDHINGTAKKAMRRQMGKLFNAVVYLASSITFAVLIIHSANANHWSEATFWLLVFGFNIWTEEPRHRG